MRALPLSIVALTLASPALAAADELEPGLTFRVYHIARPMHRLHPLDEDQTPNVDERRDVIDYPARGGFGPFRDHFYVEALGYLKIETAGRYEFRLTSDDGSRLLIGGETIVEHDGVHPATSKEGAVELDAGHHAFHIDMFENGGGEVLTLSWRPPGADDFVVVPAGAFLIEKGTTRVVSPGVKKILDGSNAVRPGDGMMLDAVHPSWSLEEIRPPGFEPQVGGMAFLPDGRLVLSSFEPVNNGVFREEPNGTIWALDHVIGGRPETISAEMIADGFHDPAGLCVVDGDIYVAHRNDITRLRDTDDDGTFETREVFASGWVSDNYHHFTFGLVEHRGSLYGSLSTSIYFGNTIKNDNVEGEVVSMNGPNPEHRGTVFRVALETGEIEYLAGGFRTPNGLGVGTGGRIFVADNQGAWLPASKFVAVKPGRFYGHYNGAEGQTSDSYPEGGSPALHSDQPVSPPTVWLPQNECANSPTESMLIREGPFTGQMYLAELTTGGIRRVFLEEVDGELQGVVFRSCQGFEAGINRMVMGPDGCLYVGCTGASGNWSWRDKRFGLQRLRPTGETTLEYESVAVRPEGFYVTFTRAIDTEWLSDPANYTVSQWHYEPTPQYGGPKHDTRRLAVSKAAPAGDGTAVTLTIPELRAGSVVHLRCDPTALDGEPMWATEAWYTLNAIPRQQTRTMRHAFRLLDRDDMRTFREPLGDWTLADGVASNGESGRTRHLVSQFEHGDVAAHIEFMIPEGSNSGVYFMGRYEIQVFDSHGVETPQHSDCGGIYQRWDPGRGSGHEGYEGVPPLVNAARPAGRWQTFDVRFRAPRFDEDGNKIRNAVFEEVVHNGRIIHEDVELTGPTRAAMFRDEKAFGPLMLQGDHGPVSYRRIRLIPLRAPSRPAGTGETSPSRR